MTPDEGSRPEGEPDRDGDAELFEMSLDHLCVAGFDGYWRRLNPSWTRTLGWTAEEMMSRPLIGFVHPDDREATLAARAGLVAGRPLLGLTNRYRCKDGTYRWFEWRSVARADRKLVYAIARDVTAQKEAQRDLERARTVQDLLQRQLMLADRLASVGTLAAGVAHEINNPLAYVMANLEMLALDLRASQAGASPPLDDWAQMTRQARQGCEQIRKIVRGLMTFSRTGEERRAVVEVKPVLELAIAMAQNEIRHRARLVREYGPLPRVEADESRLGQVFINLLVNAAQAIPEGASQEHEIRIVTSTSPEGQAVIDVLDTGPGIPAAVMGRIFDPFFTTKPVGVGTGLGLSICHTIVGAMDGRITAANRAEGGAAFRVVLPGASEPASEPRLSPSPAAAPGAPARVLVVDDEEGVGTALRRVLRGHDVTVVTAAREALALVLSGASFDVILADLMMPEMSGRELYEQLAGLRPEAARRVVFITGGAFTPAANEFLDQVPNERVEKPFGAVSLQRLVARFAR